MRDHSSIVIVRGVTVVSTLLFCTSVFAHPGWVDSECGHHDRKNGGYHYHYERCENRPPNADAVKPSNKRKLVKKKKTHKNSDKNVSPTEESSVDETDPKNTEVDNE